MPEKPSSHTATQKWTAMDTPWIYSGDIEPLLITPTNRLDIKCLQQDTTMARNLINSNFHAPRPPFSFPVMEQLTTTIWNVIGSQHTKNPKYRILNLGKLPVNHGSIALRNPYRLKEIVRGLIKLEPELYLEILETGTNDLLMYQLP